MKLAERMRAIADELGRAWYAAIENQAIRDIRAPVKDAIDVAAAQLRGLAQRLDGPREPIDASFCAGPDCHAPIVWSTLGDKPHPCDPAIVAIVVDGKVVRGRVSHYATCPNAADFRR